MIPSSWYMLLPASSLRPASARSERVLGTEITVTRDPHGRLEARDSSGRRRCLDEVNDMIMVWHGGGEPTYTIEPCPELAGGAWTAVRWGASGPFQTSVEAVQRDAVDNDHYGPVHHVQQAETRLTDRGRCLDSVTQGIISMRRLGGPPLLGHIRLDGRLHCPGLLTYRTTVTVGLQFRSLVLSAPTPIDDQRVRMSTGIATPRRLIPGTASLLRWAILRSVLVDHQRDAARWESESPAAPSCAQEAARWAAYDRWVAQFHGHGAAGAA